MKHNSIIITPYRVRTSLENTAIATSDHHRPLEFGRGMIQIDAAFDYISTYHDTMDVGFCRYDIIVDSSNNSHQRGIYLREKYQTDKPCELSISVEPIFKSDYGMLIITVVMIIVV